MKLSRQKFKGILIFDDIYLFFRYILTGQVSNNLKDLARVVSLCDHPVLIQVNFTLLLLLQVTNSFRKLYLFLILLTILTLLLFQGDTSVGKTSLVTYLAGLTGNKCVRVNNHEHTDIQA